MGEGLGLGYNGSMKKAIIVDLDGTLFNLGDRSPYDVSKCGLDTVNPAVEAVIHWARAAGLAVLLCSGRGYGEKDRFYTEAALAWNAIPYDELFMRQPLDGRKDFVVKEEIYHREIESRYGVLFVMDDRGSVVRMWRGLGLTVFQVDDRIE